MTGFDDSLNEPKFSGLLTVRKNPSGGGYLDEVKAINNNWFGQSFLVTLFIHGFNTDEAHAKEGYNEFLRRLGERWNGKIGTFFWPGDWGAPWLGNGEKSYKRKIRGLSYPFEIGDAKKSGQMLADFLAAPPNTPMQPEFILVAHSLGCRLVFELLEAIRKKRKKPRIRSIVLMGAAVPVPLVQAWIRWRGDGKLRKAGMRIKRRRVLYSRTDEALGFVFSVGQTANIFDSGFYPEAMGLRGNPVDFPTHGKVDRTGIGHGDYWEDDESANVLAEELSAVNPRISPSWHLATRGGGLTHPVAGPRETPKRKS